MHMMLLGARLCLRRKPLYARGSQVEAVVTTKTKRSLDVSSCRCIVARWYVENPMHSPWDYTDPNWSRKTKTNYDPTAKRPNILCDPYGQGGKPLSYDDAAKFRATLHTNWIFDMPPENEISIPPHMFNDGTNRKQLESSATKSEIMSGDGNNANDNFDNTGPTTTADSESEFTSAEDVQRALSDLQQRSTTMNTATAVGRKSSASPSSSLSNTAISKSNNVTSVFPMHTASEELQRIFASIPPSTTPLQPQPTKQEHGISTATTSTSNVLPPHRRILKDRSTNVSKHPSPLGLIRTFQHPDFISGSRFLHNIACVGQLTAHYPILSLERKIINRQWYIVSVVKCRTQVLGGLSSFDFHLASMIDVEVERPEVQKNLLNTSLSKA